MRHLFCFLLLLIFLSKSNAQKTLTAIQHKDLMSEQTLKITQDQKGFIWVSNRFGIDRFDGYSVKHYEIPMLANANPVRYINVIANAQKQIFAYTSNGGIYQYQSSSDTFQLITNLNFYIRTVSLDTDGRIWFGTNHKLGLLANGKVKIIEKPLLKGLLVKGIINYTSKQKIIVTDYGLFLFNTVTEEISHFFNQEQRQNFNKIQIETAFWDNKQQTLWIGTVSGNLLTYHIKSKQLDVVSLPAGTQAMIMCISELNQHTLVVGTDGAGAFLVNKADKNIVTKFNQYDTTEHLSGDAIYDVFKDKDQRIWIATDGGINLMETPLSGFRVQLRYDDKPNLIAKDVVTCMLEDANGNQWFGTNGGLSIKERSGKVNFLLKSSYILSLLQAKDGLIWVGTYGAGVYVLNPQGDVLHHYLKNDGTQSLASNFVYAIAEDNDGNIWLGGKKGMSSKFDTRSQQFQQVSLGQVNYFTKSTSGNILAATEIGLFEINAKSLKVNPHPITKALRSKYVCDIYFQGDTTIWLATYGAGLVRYQVAAGKVKYISTAGKNTQEIAYSLVPDSDGQLWVASRDKISAINLQTLRVKNYPKKLMPVNMSFFQTARMRTNAGDIFFGGTKGFISFNPKSISTPTYSEKIVFLNFNLFNKEVKAGEKGSPLAKPLDNTSEITLQHDQHSFALTFTTINFSQSVERRFLWKLDGLDKNWVGPSVENTANYTNLSPGKYLFHVKAIGNNNEVLDERTIQIVIKPAFYNTWVAYLFYVAVIVGLIYWWMKQTKTRAYLETSLAFEKKEKKRTEEVAQSKLNFFTNVSHEIRTPITLILGQTEQLLTTGNVLPALQHKLQGIHKNASSLGNLVNELLDFRKQEQGYAQLERSNVDLIELLKEVYERFSALAQQRNIAFSFDTDEDSLVLLIDRRQIEKVINNLLSNAVKACSSGDQINLKVVTSTTNVQILVEDTGKGIPSDKLQHIFDPFYQVEQTAAPGTGIGLAISKNIVELHGGQITTSSTLSKGTVFTIMLERNTSLSVEEQIIVTEEKLQTTELEQADLIEPITSVEEEAKKKLLLVEDNEELRDFLEEILAQLFHVYTAGDGEQGLEIARKEQPDLVISDVMMPVMSGTELCTKLKSNFDTCHIPVVLLTAKSAVEHQLEGLRTGADDYVTKPFHSKLLIQRCNNLINARQVLKAKYFNQPGLAQQQEVATTEIDRKFIDQATAIVEAHLHSEIDVNLFASEMGLSRSSLFSKLKGVTGLTPNTFISNIRLKKAADMLQNSPELNISQIAYNLGFSSPRYFNKCFKEQYGYAPQEYRKKHVQ
ncbi:hybrid sensor histidine kinase/response regulator transcription factor [Pedobacter ureilyticus]|uniref:histidine kinase n=1 Tax=Pedobacter ureilyticus TaxID=1393051 RepID=A0ABW9JB81_9SPHI